MKIEILEESENPLLGRKEIKFFVSHDKGTPSRKEIRKNLLKILGCEEDLLIIDSLAPKFGKSAAIGYAKIYESMGGRRVEPEHIIKKNFEMEEKGKEEKKKGKEKK